MTTAETAPAPPSPVRWRYGRSAVLAAAIVPLAVGVVLVLHSAASPHSTSWIELDHGTYDGVGWRLDAMESDGQLCMALDGVQGPSSPQSGFSGGCGFAKVSRRGDFTYMSGLGPAASVVNYGPLPSNAMTIRVAPNQVIATRPLPHVRGLARGRYWLSFSTPGQSLSTGTAQPLDSRSSAVAFQSF